MSTQGRPTDRFDCYEMCVQSPPYLCAFLRAVHGGSPELLGEDFCGTAALCRCWVAEQAAGSTRCSAVAVDNDRETLAAAAARAAAEGVAPRITFRHADCINDPGAVPAEEACDIIFTGNFSIGYIHARRELVAYLRRCRERLARRAGSMFACDTYGGAAAFQLGEIERRHMGRGEEIIRYTWRHDSADPLTGMVENSIGFRIEVAGEAVVDMPDAFTYRWRLWSIAELREAMLEAGFASTDVYRDVAYAPGQPPMPVTSGAELGLDWIVLIVART